MNYFIVLCICSVWAVSVQCKAPYKLRPTRAEVATYAKDFVEGRMWISKPDRYTNVVNGEFTIYKFPRDTKVKIKMYEFLSNEYRPFAVNYERNLCSFLVLEYKMMIYPDVLKLGAHMPEPRCPVKPGNYSFANVTANLENYPPNLPFRNWLMTIEYWHGPVKIFELKTYGTFDRDAVIREQYG